MNTIKVFKVLKPISTMFHGRFQYYFVEPYDSKLIDGIDVEELEYEEVQLNLNELKVQIKKFESPFTGKEQNYYFFNYDGEEDIFIEYYDSTSETFADNLAKKLK